MFSFTYRKYNINKNHINKLKNYLYIIYHFFQYIIVCNTAFYSTEVPVLRTEYIILVPMLPSTPAYVTGQLKVSNFQSYIRQSSTGYRRSVSCALCFEVIEKHNFYGVTSLDSFWTYVCTQKSPETSLKTWLDCNQVVISRQG